MRQMGATLLPKKSVDRSGSGDQNRKGLGEVPEPHGSRRNVFNLGEGYIGIMSGLISPPHNQE